MLPPTMCGAAALKQKLSLQLQRHIGKHIRTLQREIQKAQDGYEAELKLLGAGKDTIEEMKEELVQLCSDSKDLVTPAVHGTYTNPSGKSFFPRSVDQKGTPPQKLRARAVDENRRFAEQVRMHETTKHDEQQFALEQVEPLLRQNTGIEFPMDHNPRLVYTLFQGYSENWPKLAQEHKDKLGVICNEFLGEVIDYIWPHRMREPLRTEFLDPQMKGILRKTQEQVDLLRKDLHFEIQPYDPEYEDRLTTWRVEASKEGSYTEAEEVLEKMLIYYELSAKTFISNVITQVVERHLLQGLHNIFSWVKINKMEEKTVEAIAAEDKATRDKRMALKAKMIAIEEARDSCARIAMRKELRTYGMDEPDDAEESSDEEELTWPLTSERQKKSPKPNPVAGSSISTPLKSQLQPSREERPQTTSVEADIVTNGSVGPGSNAGFDFSTETAVARDHYFPNGWDDQPWTDYYPPVMSAPTHTPPPPPRPEKTLHQMGNQYYPLSSPDSGSRQTFPVQERYTIQTPTAEPNSHQHSNSYPQVNVNGTPNYFNNSPQSPEKKPQRKLLGRKA